MATFVPGRRITTREPRITVDAGLRAGRHRFSLVVIDDDGNQSQPDTVTVELQPRSGPVNPPPRRGGSPPRRRPRKTPGSER